MSTDRDTTRIVRSWLRAAENESADRVLGTVLDRIDTTPQRRATWWPARRLLQLNNAAKLALGAGAILVVALLGINFLVPGGPSIGGPGLETSPTPAPSPSVEAKQLEAGELEPGTYYATPYGPASSSIKFTFRVPDGWEGFDEIGLLPVTGSASPEGVAIGFNEIGRLYSDPCHGNRPGDSDVAVGPTVDDLVAALSAQTAYDTSQPAEITLGGYSGQKVDLVLPSDLDFSTCDDDGFYVWEGGPYAQGPGNRWHLWILDVEGRRVVILGSDFESTPEDKRAEMQAIIDSIEIDPQS